MIMIFNKRKAERARKNKSATCTYTVENQRKKWLVFNCKDCEERGDLTNPTCLKEVLLIMDEEPNVGGLRLSDFMERGYEDESLEVLLNMKSFIDKMDELSQRSVVLSEDQTCTKCKYQPMSIFTHLKDAFYIKIDIFYDELLKISNDLTDTKLEKKDCQECLYRTRDDIVYLFNESENLRAIIFRHGYRILI